MYKQIKKASHWQRLNEGKIEIPGEVDEQDCQASQLTTPNYSWVRICSLARITITLLPISLNFEKS